MSPEDRKALHASMTRLAAGDRRELDRVYTTLEPPLGAFCARMLGAGPDAEDATQEALVTLFGKVDAFDPSRDALSWALTIAAFACRTARKRRVRARTTALTTESHEADGAGPDEALEARELSEAVAAAVGELRPEDRAVLDDVLEGARGDAAFRKRKQRMIDRLRAILRRTYDLDP